MLQHLTLLDEPKHKTQRAAMLRLLNENDFVASVTLSRISLQYNARIKELRDGLHNGRKYTIVSAKVNDKYGYMLMGWQ